MYYQIPISNDEQNIWFDYLTHNRTLPQLAVSHVLGVFADKQQVSSHDPLPASTAYGLSLPW